MKTQRAMRTWHGLLLVCSLLAVLALPVVALAQGGDEATPPVREITDDDVNELSKLLYCPVCENIPLDVCGTAACARWRAQVRTLLEDGASDEQVISYFVEQFGERVVGTPQDPTLNFLTWAVPLGGVVIGLGVVGLVLLRWRSGRSDDGRAAGVEPFDEADATYTEDDDYRARLERELRMKE